MSEKLYSVYALYCPVFKSIRYIGVSTVPIPQRIKGHYQDKSMNPLKSGWLVLLTRRNKKPSYRVLYSGLNRKEALGIESRIIRKYKRRLYNLTHATFPEQYTKYYICEDYEDREEDFKTVRQVEKALGFKYSSDLIRIYCQKGYFKSIMIKNRILIDIAHLPEEIKSIYIHE